MGFALSAAALGARVDTGVLAIVRIGGVRRNVCMRDGREEEDCKREALAFYTRVSAGAGGGSDGQGLDYGLLLGVVTSADPSRARQIKVTSLEKQPQRS